MLILTLRTDKPEAEVGLFENGDKLAYSAWQAHRRLAETIHSQIDGILEQACKELSDIEGVVVYRGPGSFTGLRIGMSVANALAYALNVPVADSKGEDWLETGIKELVSNGGGKIALPDYGAEAKTTRQRK